MKRKLMSICAALIMIIPAIQASAANKVSVFVEGNLSALQQQIVNGAFSSRIAASKNYEFYERNETFMKAVTREHDFQLSGDMQESQIRKIASKYGVDYVVAISVMKDEDSLFMSARLISIETGKVLKTVSQDRDSATNTTLKNLSNNVAYRLLTAKSK